MSNELETASWVKDATVWSQETSFIVGNLLREIAKKDEMIKQLQQSIRNLSGKMLEK
jgi:hypothetical protein